MREFKVGDIVRLNDRYSLQHCAGRNIEARIEEIDSNRHIVLDILKSDCHFNGIMYENIHSLKMNFCHVYEEGPYSFYDRLHSRRFSL